MTTPPPAAEVSGSDTGPASATEQDRVTRLITDFAEEQELPTELGARDGELVLTLPGEKKLKTVCSLLVGVEDLRINAFVIRRPDENHADFYRYLLGHNLKLPGLAYGIDRLGDVYVIGRHALAGIDEGRLDRLMGGVLEAADSHFNQLLVLGFLTSMRREWAWRVTRGEPLKNLEAFRDILDVPGALDILDEDAAERDSGESRAAAPASSVFDAAATGSASGTTPDVDEP